MWSGLTHVWGEKPASLPHQVTPRLTCLVAATLTETQRCVLAMKSWSPETLPKPPLCESCPHTSGGGPAAARGKKKWLSPKKAAKCHHDNGWRQRVCKHLPSSHFTFQTQIDVLAKEKDERRVCNTYCSVMSQIISLYLQKNEWWTGILLLVSH